jgi:myo-inositol 2-dehydrogenase/D-chiro-inositol 1-dehydrogenase
MHEAVRRARAWVDAGHLGLPRSVNVECADLGEAVALARELTGCEPVEVFAEGTGDAVVVSVLLTHGVVASLVVGLGAVPASARLIGSHAHIEVDVRGFVVRRYGPDGVPLPVEPVPAPVPDPRDPAVAAVRRSIETGLPQEVQR